MTALALSVKQRRWDLVSLYLLLGVVRAAEALPRESLEELLGLLAGGEREGDHSATPARRGRRER